MLTNLFRNNLNKNKYKKLKIKNMIMYIKQK